VRAETTLTGSAQNGEEFGLENLRETIEIFEFF